MPGVGAAAKRGSEAAAHEAAAHEAAAERGSEGYEAGLAADQVAWAAG
jgi:hypothetical protein